MKQIVTSAPIWFVLLCIAIGLIYALVLYYKNKRQHLKKLTAFSLAVFRFLAISMIAFLLLSPMLLTSKKVLEHPVIIMAMDNSSSMKLDTAISQKYVNDWKALNLKLSKKFKVDQLTFSDHTAVGDQYDFSGYKTNFSELLRYVNGQYGQLSKCKLLIFSDGIYNAGKNPLFEEVKKGIDITTIGTGNPHEKSDIAIKNVFANEISFLNNEFPVEVVVKTTKAKGKNINLYLKKGNRILKKERLKIHSDNEIIRKSFFLKADRKGNVRYTVSADILDNEENTQNNKQDFFIEVIDEKSKILILANSPHPDVVALRKAIEKKKEYQVTSALVQTFNQDINQFDLVILHQLPALQSPKSNKIVKEITTQRIPFLLILGQQTDFARLNNADLGIALSKIQPLFNNAEAFINDKFQLFKTPFGTANLISEVPPLYCPFSDYELSNDADVLFYQQLGNVQSSMPLMAFSNSTLQKRGFIAGTGLWKWRIKDYQQNNNHDSFDALINVMVKSVIVKQNKKKFRVNIPKKHTEEELLTVSAELYNSVYEPINTPDVKLTLYDKDNTAQTYLLDKDGDKYTLDIHGLKEGIYRYEAKTTHANKLHTQKGEIVIVRENRELIYTTADFELLEKLALDNNGFFVKDSEMLQVADSLLQDKSLTPIQHIEKSYQPITHLPWILALILVLLCVEWFLRKYFSGTV